MASNRTYKKQVEGLIAGPVLEHLAYLEGNVPASKGRPGNRLSRRAWKDHLQKALGNVQDRLKRLGKPLDQVLRERAWEEEQISDLLRRLEDQGFGIPTN